MPIDSEAPLRPGRYFGLTVTLRAVAKFWSTLFEGLAWPYIELALRLWIAKLFFGFGILQLTHWQQALELAREENPIPFLEPHAAILVSTLFYLLCAALLTVGLVTRYAAVPLLALSFVTQLRYEPFDTQLFWIALSGWFVIYGAGAISLDKLLRRGLGDSAVPLVPTLIKASHWLRLQGTPIYVCVLRVWLGASLLLAAYEHGREPPMESLARWFPLDVAFRIAAPAALIGGTLFVLGAATRYVAMTLLLCLVGFSAVDPRSTDSIYLLMFLAILAIYGGGRFFTR